MPRTIESIVENHRVAAERRAAGRPIWDGQLKIKHLLNGDDDSDSEAQAVGRQIAAILRASSWFKRDAQDGGSSLVEVVEELEDVCDFEDLDEILDHLYDLADADRIWIG